MTFRNDLSYIVCEWCPYCKGHFQSFPLRQFQATFLLLFSLYQETGGSGPQREEEARGSSDGRHAEETERPLGDL